MNNTNPTKFPWLKFLLDNLLWAILIMLFLGVLIWYFGSGEIESQFGTARPISSLAMSLVYDLIFALIVLVPCFYAGMGGCVWLEKRGGKYQEQYETAFTIAYYALFFVFIALYALWIYAHYQPENTSIVTFFNPLRLLIVGYIFHGNVEDDLWSDIFEKRE